MGTTDAKKISWFAFDVILLVALTALFFVVIAVDTKVDAEGPFMCDDSAILAAAVHEMAGSESYNGLILDETLTGPLPVSEREILGRVNVIYKKPLRAALSGSTTTPFDALAAAGFQVVNDRDIPVDECRPWRKPPRLRVSGIGYDLRDGTAALLAGFEPVAQGTLRVLLFEANDNGWELRWNITVYNYKPSLPGLPVVE